MISLLSSPSQSSHAKSVSLGTLPYFHSEFLYPIQLLLHSPCIIFPDSCPMHPSLSFARYLFSFPLTANGPNLSLHSFCTASVTFHSCPPSLPWSHHFGQPVSLSSPVFVLSRDHDFTWIFELPFSPVPHPTSVLPFPSTSSAPSHPRGWWDGPCCSLMTFEQ